MDDDQHCHLSYLLRVWAVDQNGSPIWRASLESSRTGERLGFRNLDALFTFLRQHTSTAPEPNTGQSASVELRPGKRDPELPRAVPHSGHGSVKRSQGHGMSSPPSGSPCGPDYE